MVSRYKAVFLDRDGVLVKSTVKNRKAYAPKTFKDFKIYKDSLKCIKKLSSIGYKTIVVTNQPDVEKKIISKKTLNKMHLLLKKKKLKLIRYILALIPQKKIVNVENQSLECLLKQLN